MEWLWQSTFFIPLSFRSLSCSLLPQFYLFFSSIYRPRHSPFMTSQRKFQCVSRALLVLTLIIIYKYVYILNDEVCLQIDIFLIANWFLLLHVFRRFFFLDCDSFVIFLLFRFEFGWQVRFKNQYRDAIVIVH